MTSAHPTWRKSSFSNPTNCVELAWPGDGGAVRDTKNVAPVLVVSHPVLAGFIDRARQGLFDLR